MAPTNASTATEPMDGKEKPSSNLDVEGQSVRTTNHPKALEQLQRKRKEMQRS